MNKPTLYLMVGYPGAGKTTVSKIISKLTGAKHLWADKFRRKMFASPTHSHKENLELYERLNNLADQHISAGKSVIYDTNFSFYSDRQKMRDMANKHNATLMLIWVTTPRTVAMKRATDGKGHESRILGDMLESEFNRMADNLERPKSSEHAIEIVGKNVTPETVKSSLGL